MGRRRCCCPCPEAITDEFGRNNSTNINASWVEEVGDWDILGFTLRSDATANAAAIWQIPPGGNKISFYVTGESGPEDENDILRVIVNFVDDQNYFFAEWFINDGLGYLSLNKRADGVNVELASLSSDDPGDEGGGMTITVCFTPRIFYASLSGRADADLWVIDPTYYVDGFLAGLGADETVSRFDSFSWNEHFYSNNQCTGCACYCDQYPLPKFLDITLNLSTTPDPDPDNHDIQLVECIDGASTTLTYQSGTGEWTGIITASGQGCTDCSELLDDYECTLVFTCEGKGGDPIGDFFLSATDNGSFFETDPDMDNLGQSDGETCSPLLLTWSGSIGPQCEPPELENPSTSTGIDFTYTITE